MNSSLRKPGSEFYNKIKWLMFFRVLFTTLLLGSTIILQLEESPSPLARPLLFFYGLIAGIFFLSFIYSLILLRVKQGLFFAYIQCGLDTFIVTLIIYVTGCFSSIFSFLYLVVIVYSSMLLFRKGSMIMASLCCIQYGIMVDLEYYGIILPSVIEGGVLAANYDWSIVLYRIIMIIFACFAVAFLSSLLAEQTESTKKELLAMKHRVKRVERLAAIGEMAAGLTHEIKNPLASLTGAIQLLKDEISYNYDHDKLMQIVLRETDRLSTLASNFLLFAKPPAGKVEKIKLDKALRDIVELFEKDSACGGKILIKNELHPDIWIEMDPAHLRQVFWNLLLNAAEAAADTPADTPADTIDSSGVIEIKTYPLNNEHVCIKITDNGCGMSGETVRSIFDPFFTTKHSGTGLGLSIVHSILESYNIWIDVESEIDQGTTFTLNVKMIDPPA